jgi:hypothetical protein
MFAQLLFSGSLPEHQSTMDRIVADELIPALQRQPGFVGTLNLVDRDTGEAMMIVLWETSEQARRPLNEYAGHVLGALRAIAAFSNGNRAASSVWEVNARV